MKLILFIIPWGWKNDFQSLPNEIVMEIRLFEICALRGFFILSNSTLHDCSVHVGLPGACALLLSEDAIHVGGKGVSMVRD